VHESDPNRRPDSDFQPGSWEFLVPGNACRLLDGRRTPGVIESYDPQTGLFRWRILAFEDEGRYWDVPAEHITRYQFPLDAHRLTPGQADRVQRQAQPFQEPLKIPADRTAQQETERQALEAADEAHAWLQQHSRFLPAGKPLVPVPRSGHPELADDLEAYLELHGLAEVEQRTADLLVLNPASGEWIKGMEMTLAQMGLAAYQGTVPRTPDIFAGLGSRANRHRYLVQRLGFVRAVFRQAGIDRVVLYRGMSTENDLTSRPRTFLSFTFSLRVGRAFADFDQESRHRNAYLVKLTVPIEKLWMTCLETRAFNRQYQEAEALVLADEDVVLSW
jgi:hypothetical protein